VFDRRLLDGCALEKERAAAVTLCRLLVPIPIGESLAEGHLFELAYAGAGIKPHRAVESYHH
jgi:hypothetical protein